MSVGWAKKVSAQRNRTGQAERIRHQPGRKPHAGLQAQQQVKAWIGAKPDLTLSEIQIRLSAEAGVKLSLPQSWRLLRKLGLTSEKSPSTVVTPLASRKISCSGERPPPEATGRP